MAVAAEAVRHLRVRSLACPAALLLFVANGAFRGARDTRCVVTYLRDIVCDCDPAAVWLSMENSHVGRKCPPAM